MQLLLPSADFLNGGHSAFSFSPINKHLTSLVSETAGAQVCQHKGMNSVQRVGTSPATSHELQHCHLQRPAPKEGKEERTGNGQ